MDSVPISALQHLLYCERQCALIHIERLWEENFFTADGRVMHERAHEGPSESRPGVRIARGLSLKCERLGLHGQADVVEFHRDGKVVPVEYKRGKPKGHRADEVQLCAQALCLEEMLGVCIPAGFLFYGKNRHRTEVVLDLALRALTESLATRLHALIASRETPPPIFESKKCSACSLIEVCVPRLSKRPAAGRWFERQLADRLAEDSPSIAGAPVAPA
ncbi:MAG: CRISPR-associated protein Cas4 [Terrimicrobiaceae bacterium]|nr:CRISPR-associated protein Cas4 [Terrimicrobiaceae bacterium]